MAFHCFLSWKWGSISVCIAQNRVPKRKNHRADVPTCFNWTVGFNGRTKSIEVPKPISRKMRDFDALRGRFRHQLEGSEASLSTTSFDFLYQENSISVVGCGLHCILSIGPVVKGRDHFIWLLCCDSSWLVQRDQ